MGEDSEWTAKGDGNGVNRAVVRWSIGVNRAVVRWSIGSTELSTGGQ